MENLQSHIWVPSSQGPYHRHIHLRDRTPARSCRPFGGGRCVRTHIVGGIKALDAAEGFPLLKITLIEEELRVWKQLLPALAERSRASLQHGVDCKYLSQGSIPSHLGFGTDPLCHCGWGKKTEEFLKRPEWAPLAPFVIRTALSPLFGVPYIDKVQTCSRGRDASVRCLRGRGKTKTPHVHSM